MPLTETQRQALNRLSVVRLIELIDNGTVSFPDDFTSVDEEKKRAIQQMLATRPNPMEQQEWSVINHSTDLQSSSEEELKQLRLQFVRYVRNWERSMPQQNHVDEARAKVEEIEQQLRSLSAEREQQAWEQVDTFSVESMLDYLRTFPESVHKSEIDESVWNLLSRELSATNINKYLSAFPNGNHAAQARRAQQAYAQWRTVKSNCDLMEVHQYVEDNPESPFIDEARFLLSDLKEREMARMKHEAASYSGDRLLEYINKGVFTESHLISNGIVTETILETLCKIDEINLSMPDMATVIDGCRQECAENRTDVYLFGIPSTGKSCVLMGLVNSSELQTDTVRAGGPYAAALCEFLEYGLVVPRTPIDFVTTIQAKVQDENKAHFVNLVEMAGEDFADKIADNMDGDIFFEDMGEGVPKLLGNANQKAFFIIVDPTTTIVRGTSSRTGRTRTVNQKRMLMRLINLFAQPENESVMKLVDSIHVIVTKSDTLGDRNEREENAYNLFMERYSSLLPTLKELCDKYGINVATNGYPKLYTFSLGEFYPGGIYEYDESDSDKIIEVIKGNVYGEKKSTFVDNVRAIFNKPIL